MVTEISNTTNGPSFSPEAFAAVHQFRAENEWLSEVRSRAFERFSDLGFPSTRNEDWKYTNVAPLSRLDFQLPPDSEVPGTFDSFIYPEAANSRVVFHNGRLREELSDLSGLPPGVVVQDIDSALRNPQLVEVIKQNLTRNADQISNGFVALNTAFFNSGLLIYVPRNSIVSTPLNLSFVSAESANFPRLLVVTEEGSELTLIESYEGTGENVYLTNAVVELVIGQNARVDHYKVQRDSLEAYHVSNTAVKLGRSSCYDTTSIMLGGKLSRHDISVVMDAEGAECRVDGLYLVTGTQHTDTHSVIDHRKPHCTSRQLYKGILDGKSRAVFNGKVFVRHDAQKTDAMQTNKNLLLSNDARVDTKPQLEILADDVKCAHGAAVGQLDEDELFYLKTRGIHSDLARNLLTYGFAEEVIEKIKVESIKSQLDETVLNRLNARLEA
jgi:Fe-S cluster assembly protein SufD